MSSVDQSKSNEAGGLQGTAQNLGASLGTALIGAVLISGLTTGFISRIDDNPAVTPAVQAQLAEAVSTGIPVVPVDDVEQALLDAGVPPAEATAVADGLRRRAARGAEEGAARRGPARGRVALVHAPPARAPGRRSSLRAAARRRLGRLAAHGASTQSRSTASSGSSRRGRGRSTGSSSPSTTARSTASSARTAPASRRPS